MSPQSLAIVALIFNMIVITVWQLHYFVVNGSKSQMSQKMSLKRTELKLYFNYVFGSFSSYPWREENPQYKVDQPRASSLELGSSF